MTSAGPSHLTRGPAADALKFGLLSARCAVSNGDELRDRFQYPPIDLLLRFAGSRKLSLSNQQRVIAAFDEMEKRWCRHFRADALEKIQRTK